MGYFSQDDIQTLCGDNTKAKTGIRDRFLALHNKVYNQIQANDLQLSLLRSSSDAVLFDSAGRYPVEDDTVLSVQYTRSRSNAVTIERLMGREEVASVNNLIMRLHPVLEMRLCESGLVIELLIAPDAWWDQQNLKGKLSISRHRHEFYSMLMELQPIYAMGFWEGIHLSEMRLNGKYFQHPRILDEWLSTFTPHSDWFRVGIWYDIDHEDLDDTTIATMVFEQIQALYPVYQYFLWTSENNYRDFHNGK